MSNGFYMLRRSGLYYRAALLLQSANLSLHECCLLWNYYATSSARLVSVQLEYQAIERKKEEAFLLTFEQVKAFAGISAGENAIDYLLGAYLLFPHPQTISEGYWLAPTDWLLTALPKTSKPVRSTYKITELCRKHLAVSKTYASKAIALATCSGLTSR